MALLFFISESIPLHLKKLPPPDKTATWEVKQNEAAALSVGCECRYDDTRTQ
jgi:hypothetical protein